MSLSIGHRSPVSGLQPRQALIAGAALAVVVAVSVGCPGDNSGKSRRDAAAPAAWVVRPFRLDQVELGPGLFQRKRDRMLEYALNYGGGDLHAGPDRLLSIFRANAGIDTRGAEAVGGWETETGYLRGHYAGHFMTMLAQAWASTGDEIYKQKLDYMVEALRECQVALAAAAERPTPRVGGRHGRALTLSGSPLGLAEHVRIPAGALDGLEDFTIATWIKLAMYEASELPDQRQTPEQLVDGTAIFDFGRPNDDYAESPLTHMYLTVRDSDQNPLPRFAMTRRGVEGEESLVGNAPLEVGSWVHLAITRAGSKGTLWVDGQPVAVNEAMSLTVADLGDLTDNWLGRRQFPQRSVSYLNAVLDDFQILGRALGAAELRQLMGAPETSLETERRVWYRFDESEGPVALDSSGRGANATVIGPWDGRRHPGFLSAYPETQFVRLEEFATYGRSQGIWAPYYTLHKIMAGLLDAYVLADNDLALEVVAAIADWVVSRTAPLSDQQLDRMWDIYIAGEYGGINESLANLHALRPERTDYLEAATRFVNRSIYVPVAEGDDVLEGRHANQHIPQFTGYLRGYEEGLDADFLAASKNFWDMVVPHRTYSHGGVGVGEMFRARDAQAASLFAEPDHAETCPLYNMLKLSRNLFFHDPDPKYMNYYELGLFNQMLASRRDVDTADSPEVTYFVPVQPGSRRRYGNSGTCCGGTGMESHTKYQDSIYFRSADDSTLWVNLYIASTLRWSERDFTVTQETRFPEEGASRLVIDGDGALDLELRVPTWVRDGWVVRINGEEQKVRAVPGTYLTLSRDWSRGDVVDVTMPFRLRVESAIDDPSVQSLYYGPILLAAQAGRVGEDLDSGLIELSLYRHLKLDGDLAAAFTPIGQPLRFTTAEIEFAPFYVSDPADSAAAAPPTDGVEELDDLFGETRPYHLYFRRHEPSIVFGSVNTFVPNVRSGDGVTFLDAVWSRAPFENHDAFLSMVDRLAGEWVEAGLMTTRQRDATLTAARRAEEDLAP